MGDRGTAEAALQRRRGIYPYGGEGGKTKWGEGGRRMIRPLDRIDGGEGESGRGVRLDKREGRKCAKTGTTSRLDITEMYDRLVPRSPILCTHLQSYRQQQQHPRRHRHHAASSAPPPTGAPPQASSSSSSSALVVPARAGVGVGVDRISRQLEREIRAKDREIRLRQQESEIQKQQQHIQQQHRHKSSANTSSPSSTSPPRRKESKCKDAPTEWLLSATYQLLLMLLPRRRWICLSRRQQRRQRRGRRRRWRGGGRGGLCPPCPRPPGGQAEGRNQAGQGGKPVQGTQVRRQVLQATIVLLLLPGIPMVILLWIVLLFAEQKYIVHIDFFSGASGSRVFSARVR